MQQWGENYWETYSRVVNMLSVRLLLAISHLHDLETQSIDFVLAFPQADLDVDVWMELPDGMNPEGVDKKDRWKYVLKLNKSLYGLKQASYMMPGLRKIHGSISDALNSRTSNASFSFIYQL